MTEAKKEDSGGAGCLLILMLIALAPFLFEAVDRYVGRCIDKAVSEAEAKMERQRELFEENQRKLLQKYLKGIGAGEN